MFEIPIHWTRLDAHRAAFAMADDHAPLDKKTVVLRIVVGVAMVLLPLAVVFVIAFLT